MPRAVVAQFQKDLNGTLVLFAVVVLSDKGRTLYDVDHSRAYGYLFHQSGFGGRDPIPVDGIYHVSGDADVQETPCRLFSTRGRTRALRKLNRTRRLTRLPSAFDGLLVGQDLLDWLERNAIQEDAIWCGTCRDHLPESSLCDHVWWCDKKTWYSTPADRKGCTCETWAERRECFA